MKKKEEVFVRINTPKKAKKVIKVLELFKEKYMSACIVNTRSYYNGIRFYDDTWCAIRCEKEHDGKTEVSIKELRNILAVEHLKEGDVVLVKNNSGKWIVKLTGNNIDRFEHSVSYNLDLGVLNDEKFTERHNKIYGASFIRYATEKEKALLNDELTEADYKLGVWYKSKNGSLIYFNDTEKTYGFFSDGKFSDKIEWLSVFRENGFHKPGYWVEATKDEVEQALIKEAKKRYNVGDNIECLSKDCPRKIAGTSPNILYTHEDRDMWYGGVKIYDNGKWAEIVEPSFVESSPLTVTLEIKDIATLQVIQKTLKELEEKLTKLI